MRAVTVVGGEGAPSTRPPDAAAHGYAAAACTDAVASYAAERGGPPTGILSVAVISDTEWIGAETPVICAIPDAP